ncbi:MAG: hypothetical protein FJX64_07245 [Alphaproteobacteria bacterium]|nr:hypothetical protein [Alphaproteobacteria bacterium]
MTMAIQPVAVSAIQRLFATVRAVAARYLTEFLRTPLAWALLLGIGVATYAHADLREGNRMACAATSVTIDRQEFLGVAMDGGVLGGAAFQRACEGMALPGPIWSRMRNTRNWAWR